MGDETDKTPPADGTIPMSPAEAAAFEAEIDPANAPKVDFATFVLSLAATAVMNLSGESADGRVAGGVVNLEGAAQHIDILVMLEAKTKGNLTAQELHLIQSVLYDLRMQYLEAAQR